MTRRLLELLGKILKEIREMVREHETADSLLTSREKGDLEIITRMYRQQKNHFQSKDCRKKEHYDLKRVKARTKLTEILYIFFGIHTANVVQLADRIEQRAHLLGA